MKRLILAALACALLVCGCGKSASPGASRSLPAATPQPQTIPASSIAIPPESARTPEGAKGADQSHYLNGLPPATLTGPGIHIDAFGAQLIEGFENVYESRYCPYWDPYGHVWTRAFGETDWSGDFGGVCISHSQAETNVRILVEDDYQYAVRGLGINLSQTQVDALDDFVWNLGAGIFTGTLRVQIQHREWSAILAYDRAGGMVLSGLASRRQHEYELLISTPPKPVETVTQRRAREERELHGHETVRRELHSKIEAHKCRLDSKGHGHEIAHTHKQWQECRDWIAHGGVEIALEAKLRKEIR